MTPSTILRVSPVSRMPSELWAEIFLDTGVGEDILDNGSFNVYNHEEPGYVIAAVCRTWRDIIVNDCPSLWADLFVKIVPSTRSQARMESPLAMVLARSHKHPLHLQFEVAWSGADNATGVDRDSVGILELLLKESARWRTATLHLATLHLPLLDHQRTFPQLTSCSIIMRQTDLRFVGETDEDILPFESATNLTQLKTSGLGPSTTIVVPFAELRVFEDMREEITTENLDCIISMLPFASNLTRLEMLYFQVVEGNQVIRNHALLPSVTHFRVGSKIVVDLVTLPVLEGLFLEPVCVSLTDLHYADFDPETLISVRSLLERSQCQRTLREIELQNVPMSHQIVDVLRLCPNLDTILFEYRDWDTVADIAFGAMVSELGRTNVDGSFACTPILTLLMLNVEYSSEPTILSFFNENLVRTMEARVPADPHEEQRFSVSINIDNPVATLPLFSRTLRARLVHCEMLGSSCTLTVGSG